MLKRTYLKTLFLLTIFTFVCGNCLSQDLTQKPPFWSKVSYGGGVNIGFGSGSFSLGLYPSAIYNFDEHWALGAGLSVNYAKFNYSKLFAYGGTLLAYYSPIRVLQLSAEFEQVRVNREYDTYGGSQIEDNYWSPALFLGAGFRTNNVTIGLKYDVLYDDDKSIYGSPFMPFVRVYF